MLIRCTFFLEQLGYGFTESLWIEGTSLTSQAVTSAVYRYATKRIMLSGKETFLQYVRLSQEGVFRDAIVIAYPNGGLQGHGAATSDAPMTALLMRMRSPTNANARTHYLRGIWDNVVDVGGKFVPTSGYTTRLNDWMTALTADVWGWLGATTRATGNIQTVTQAANGTVSVITEAALFPGPFPQDATVNISGVEGATQLNGPQIVRAASAIAFSTRRRIAIFDYETGGRVTLSTKTFIPISIVERTRIAERRCGRPSYLSVG